MKVNFGISEILVILSYFFYKVSFTYSVTCFIVGLLIKLFDFVLEHNRQNEIQQIVLKSVDKLVEYFKKNEKVEQKTKNRILGD